jgi:hypothetical protein
MSEHSFIQTYSGRKFNFLDPDPETITIVDIAHALSQTCRFGGHTSKFYSVADHSVNVARLLAWEGYSIATIEAGLFHDSAEAFLGDMVTPLKRMLPQYAEMEKRITNIIHRKFAIDLSDVGFDAIKQADEILLVAEAKILFDYPPIDNWTERYPPLPRHVRLHVSKTPKEAEYYFLAAASILLDEPVSAKPQWHDAEWRVA